VIFPTVLRRRSALIVLLACCYFFAGRLSLLLAIPPGYATAIFPSSGVALAALLLFGNRLWPGIMLGSYLLNLTMPAHFGGFFSSSGLVAMAIAVGATLQGLTGAVLVRRFVGFPTNLADEKSIFRYYLLSGPVSCIVSSVIGTTSLYLTGAIAAKLVYFTWWNWWVGDVIGIFIMTPLSFAAFAYPRDLWRQRLFSVVPPLIASLVAMIVVFFMVNTWESKHQRDDFHEYAQSVTDSLISNLSVYSALLEASQHFFMSDPDMTRAQFRTFIRDVIQHHHGIKAMEWLPVVKDAQRLEFERKVKADGFPDFHLTEANSEGMLVPASHSDDYVPVLYFEPYLGNEPALGFNLASNPTRLVALMQARDSGEPAATARIKLVQEQSEQYGFLLIRPVYEHTANGMVWRTSAERIQHIRGYTLAVLRMNDVLGSMIKELESKHVGIQVRDISAPMNEQLLFQSANWSNAVTTSVSQEITLAVGGRQWRIAFLPLPDYLMAHRTRQAWFVLAGGLLFTGLMGSVLLLITGKTVLVQKMIKERTEELSIILDNVIDGIITVDHQSSIKSFNPAAAAIFGYHADEVIGRPLDILLADVNRYDFDAYIKDSGFDDSIVNYLYYCELVGIRKDGNTFPLDFAMSRSLQHAKPLFIGVVRDITERNRIERLKNEFISTVSHELRTPLTSIRGVLSLIANGVLGVIPEQASQMIMMAHKNSLRLTSLINDLLDIDKMASGKLLLQLECQPLMPLIKQALESIKAYGEQYHVKFVLVGHEDVWVQVSDERIVQVLNNFFSNAAKFSVVGSQVEVVVRKVERAEMGSAIRVEVVDHGAGIPADFREMIFKKFSQQDASNTKKKGGTGLGLAISKELIERMNGVIGFESEEGLGACFYFELPIQNREV